MVQVTGRRLSNAHERCTSRVPRCVGLTLRWSGPPPAWPREPLWLIIRLSGPCRWRPLSSNVRQHTKTNSGTRHRRWGSSSRQSPNAFAALARTRSHHQATACSGSTVGASANRQPTSSSATNLCPSGGRILVSPLGRLSAAGRACVQRSLLTRPEHRPFVSAARLRPAFNASLLAAASLGTSSAA